MKAKDVFVQEVPSTYF